MPRLIQAPTPIEFSKIVEQYEKEYQPLESIYLSSLQNLKKVNDTCKKKDIEAALCPYLLKWGRMGRVLGYKGCYRISKAINELEPQLNMFTGTSLLTLDLKQNADKIEDLYDELLNSKWISEKGKAKRVGPTATAKVLHILLPDTFMIWDRKVRSTYNFLDNGNEYHRFLENMQDWNRKLNNAIEPMQTKYRKSSTKLLDEYNWKKCWG